MRVLAVSASPCLHDARPRFTAQQLAALGHEVVLICREHADAPAEEALGKARLVRRIFNEVPNLRRSRSLGPAARGWIRLLGFWRSIAGALGAAALMRACTLSQEFWAIASHGEAFVESEWQGRVDIVHATGLPALPGAGRLARLYGARLVYDIIELERDRNARYNPAFHWMRLRLERYWIRQADACAAVSEEISLQAARDYAVRLPDTIYNTGPADPVEPGLRKAIGLDAEATLAVYIGAAAKNRGLEAAIRATGLDPSLHLAVIGPLTEVFQERYGAIVEAAGAVGRVHAAAARAPGAAARFVADADVALALGEPTCASYIFALPNKLFQSVTAGLPVIVGRTRALRRISAATGIGEAVDERDPAALAAAIRRQAARHGQPRYRAARAAFLARYGDATSIGAWGCLYGRLARSASRDSRHIINPLCH